MTQKITLDIIDTLSSSLAEEITRAPRTLSGCRYADIRLEVGESQSAGAENGTSKTSAKDYHFMMGIRVLAGKTLAAPGYYGLSLGTADLPKLPALVKEGLRHAHQRARRSAALKARAREMYGPLAKSLSDTRLAPIPVSRDTVPAEYRVDPRTVPLTEIVRTATETSQAVAGTDPAVSYNYIALLTSLIRQLFASSEGTHIDQTWAITQGVCYVVAVSDGVSQELYDYVGHQRGWEVITEGVQEELIRCAPFSTFAQTLAKDAAALTRARLLPTTDKEVVVVTDPHYNTLVAHEIIGHPVELDRALKMETAYAGRSWLLKSLTENQIGKRVASPLVSAFSDPTLPGYGHYKYDDEGTPARRVMHIENGVFKGFMNSRQTAAILGETPNGSWKAAAADLVPLIRMSNTVFAAGSRDPQEILREVDHGYYVVGHRIPSIAESRENFRISAVKVYEITHGQIGELFRDGAVMADTRDYLMKVDAVGNDLRLYPIPNCGKGQPMQTKRLGNGGPTMRSCARLVGGRS